MTAFSQDHWEETKAAHLAAREQFYPGLWPNAERIQFVDTTEAVAYLKYGIDCIEAVTAKGFRAPLKFFIQERWRTPSARKYKDATVTEWNTVTDLPSELHKIAAQIFVYGYYDPFKNRILGALAINVPQMIRELGEGRLPYTHENRPTKDQPFIGIKWNDLGDVGAIMHSTLNLSKSVESLPEITSRFTPEEHQHWGFGA